MTAVVRAGSTSSAGCGGRFSAWLRTCMWAATVAASCAQAEWHRVERADLPITIATTGTVESMDKVHIGPPTIFGWRMTISMIVPEGKQVREGEVLVRFEGSSQDRRITELESDLDLKTSELAALREQQVNSLETERLALAEARSNAERAARKADQPAESIPAVEYRKLAAHKDLTASLLAQQDKANELKKRLRALQVELLEVSIARLEKTLASAREDQDKYVIRSPREGIAVIGSKWDGEKLDVGDRVHPGLVIVYVVQDGMYGVEAHVPEHLAASIEEGQRVLIQGDAASGDAVIGWIDRVENSVRRESRGSRAMVRGFTVRLDDRDVSHLKLGSSVQLTIETEIARGSVAVPVEAIVYREGIPGVDLSTGWREVTLGRRSGDLLYIVEQGLEDGERVRM